MLLTISTTMNPATDLGYIVAKHPGRAQTFDLPFGQAHVFYPDASDDLCTVALLLGVDPVELVRGKNEGKGGGLLEEYINDRPYVASSLMSVAIAKVMKSAMSGQCKEKSDLPNKQIPLTAVLSAVTCRRGDSLIRRLFEPLGYEVTTTLHPLDENFPEWGESHYWRVELKATTTVRDLLTHLYILIPVLDKDKHYEVGHAEIDKLLKHGGSWLSTHPVRDIIVKRYLGYSKQLIALTGKRLEAAAEAEAEADVEPAGEADASVEGLADATTAGAGETTSAVVENGGEAASAAAVTEEAVEERISLHTIRHRTVLDALKAVGAKSVIDLGCGGGKLLVDLFAEPSFSRIIGLEPSAVELGWARRRLRLWKIKDEAEKARIELLQGALTYTDSRLVGFDAAVLVEVIEHIDTYRLPAVERSVFGYARPKTVIVTTPNREYNVLFPFLPAGELRHKDHRFEWTRAEFAAWAEDVAGRYGYALQIVGIGPEDEQHGAPSQMAVFSLAIDGVITMGSDRLAIEDVLGFREVTTPFGGVKIFPRQAMAGFEVMSRFAVDPRWLVYLPPTMSPCSTSQRPDCLEYPTEAFEHFSKRGVTHVICEEKHMGSRAVVVVCKDAQAARARFGIDTGERGICYTRTGRRFFDDLELERLFIDKVGDALVDSGVFEELQSEWVVLDCELMPWSAKAQGLLRNQYGAVGAAAVASLTQVVGEIARAASRGVPVDELGKRFGRRLECAGLFRESYGRYCWPANSLADYKLAPFHILASEGAVHADKSHLWHLELIGKVAAASGGLVMQTAFKVIDVTNDESRAEGTRWWEELTAGGGEGMVVKPVSFLAHCEQGLVQPAVKVRGREYLRIIYGPDYTENLDRLRARGLGAKRVLAIREFSLGIEGLRRFVAKQPLTRVHECAFGVLAMESEMVDPRL